MPPELPTAKMLLIVDPQIDFINGSLPVPGAEKAMDLLADFVVNHAADYQLICVTCDRHPLRHSSFTCYGGQWPAHCIESSVGAAVWPALMAALEMYASKVRFFYKGEDTEKDEYSIFGSQKGNSDLSKLIEDYNVQEIDICGLAGDVCVAATLTDALRLHPHISYRLLPDFTASLDGGTKVARLSSDLSL